MISVTIIIIWPHGRKVFEYKFCTPTAKLSNQNDAFIVYDIFIFSRAITELDSTVL